MAVEIVTKRTIWVVKCDCKGPEEDQFTKMWTEEPPREARCPHCGKWHEPKEETYIGKDKFDGK